MPLEVEALVLVYHRWIDNLFAISGFQSTDYLAPHFGGSVTGQWRLGAENLRTFLLLYSPSSTMDINFEECIRVNHPSTVVALLAYLSARICVTPCAPAPSARRCCNGCRAASAR